MDELIRTIIAAILFLFTTELFCDEKTNASSSEMDIETRKRSVTNKVNLLGRLVQDSPASVRIVKSENQGAKDLLQQATAAWHAATEELESMSIEKAEESVKHGLILMTQASSSVADKERLENAQRTRYQQLRERIQSFTDAFQRIEKEKQSRDISLLLDLKGIDTLLNQAEELADRDSYMEANQLLSRAADNVEIALAQARHKETLLHDLTFNSREEEYNYEKQRNHSYVLLADLIRKKKTHEAYSLTRFQNALEENEILRKQAEKLASKGEIETAIITLEQGTQNLARTLRASGVAF